MAIFHDGPPADFATRPATPQTVRRHRMLRPPLRLERTAAQARCFRPAGTDCRHSTAGGSVKD